MKNYSLLVSVCGVAITLAPAYATDSAEVLQKKKTVTSQQYVDTKLAEKQPILESRSGDYVVLYPKTGDADGEVGAREIVSDTAAYDNRDTELLTAGVANRLLQIKQDIIEGTANNSGDVITYNGTYGGTAFKPVYKPTGTFAAQKNALVEADQVNSAIIDGFNAHVTCGGTMDGECVLWRINPLNTSYFPQNQ